MTTNVKQPRMEPDLQTCPPATSARSSAHHSSASPHDTRLVQDEDELFLHVKWSRSTYVVELTPQQTVTDLKQSLFQLTDVLPKRQKILGLPSPPACQLHDGVPLGQLPLKPGHNIIMVGTREEDIDALNKNYLSHHAEMLDEVDCDMLDDPAKLRHAFRNKLERRIESTEFRIMNPPRPGKKLLVLDLDYTLFDCKGTSPIIADWARPGLHRLLASAYCSYDIVIWSQTSWRWLEAKLTGLSMLFASNYKLAFVLDRSSMFSIKFQNENLTRRHEVKALEIIWRRFPQWNATNTIHIDDLSKNFALNPQSGLQIQPFRRADVARYHDRELYLLEVYLKLLASGENDFTTLDHRTWKRYAWDRRPLDCMDAEVNQGPQRN